LELHVKLYRKPHGEQYGKLYGKQYGKLYGTPHWGCVFRRKEAY